MTGPRFEHQRHKPPAAPAAPLELVVVCPVFRSRVNLSRIVRAAGCFGVRCIIAARPFSLDREIARDAMDFVEIESRGSLAPVLEGLRRDGYCLVGLEQATGSQSLFAFSFPRRTALLLGHERLGIPAEELQLLDAVAEIPVFGRPLSHNVAAAATIAMYEYCRQHATVVADR